MDIWYYTSIPENTSKKHIDYIFFVEKNNPKSLVIAQHDMCAIYYCDTKMTNANAIKIIYGIT